MKATLFDTDMHIHRLSIDQPVRKSAEKQFLDNRPSAMSEFSIVEFIVVSNDAFEEEYAEVPVVGPDIGFIYWDS